MIHFKTFEVRGQTHSLLQRTSFATRIPGMPGIRIVTELGVLGEDVEKLNNPFAKSFQIKLKSIALSGKGIINTLHSDIDCYE